MNIDKINQMCDSIDDETNQMINSFAHVCAECKHFEPVDKGICFKYQEPVNSWDKCELCEGKEFIQMFVM